MKRLQELAKKVHDMLTPMYGSAFHPSQAMCGALTVVNAGDARVLFEATANYNPGRGHVEQQLMSALFLWTQKTLETPFILPPGCSVYLYVYNSPCEKCADLLANAIRRQAVSHARGWGQAANNGVQWYLGFTCYYLNATGGYRSRALAEACYKKTLVAAGWKTVVVPEAAPAPAPRAAAAVAAAAAAVAGGGGGGAAAAAAAPDPFSPAG